MDYTIPVITTAYGEPALPSAAKRPDGQPRFHLPLIRELCSTDGGIRHLLMHEGLYSGYEAPSRLFFDEHLQPGDTFIDVGAHWGIFSFTAATRWPGEIRVVAVEPHPQNVILLLRGVELNGLSNCVEVVAMAAGAEPGVRPLNFGSTMGHSLVESYGVDQPRLEVPILPLDGLLAERADLMQGHIFLKIDVEGFEYEVIVGARKLLASGRVAAVLWEKGHSYNREPGQTKLRHLVDELQTLGFTLHRFPSHDMGGPLIPFAATAEVGNIFALAPGFKPKPLYLPLFEKRAPFNIDVANPSDSAARTITTTLLRDARSSDGARWADPRELADGAVERAAAAARWIAAGSKVLDLGAGAMCLQQKLPADCSYRSADLIARSEDCQVVDLNGCGFPVGEYDVTVLLEVLEYLHDVPAVLEKCRTAAPRLICSYEPHGSETVASRRSRGWFNDYSSDAFSELLERSGWKAAAQVSLGSALLYSCEACE